MGVYLFYKTKLCKFNCLNFKLFLCNFLIIMTILKQISNDHAKDLKSLKYLYYYITLSNYSPIFGSIM